MEVQKKIVKSISIFYICRKKMIRASVIFSAFLILFTLISCKNNIHVYAHLLLLKLATRHILYLPSKKTAQKQPKKRLPKPAIKLKNK